MSRATDLSLFEAAGLTDTATIATQKPNEDINTGKGNSGTTTMQRTGNQTNRIYVTGGVTVSRWSQTVATNNENYVKPFIRDHNSIMATVGFPGAGPAIAPAANQSPAANALADTTESHWVGWSLWCVPGSTELEFVDSGV